MTHQLGGGPVSKEYREKLNAIATLVDEIFNGTLRGPARQVGFVILQFPFGHADGARCNFISNGADRRDIVALMKEMIARFEGQPELSGRA